MQGPTSRYGSTSTVNSSTPSNSLASSLSTLVEPTPRSSYALSVNHSILSVEAEDLRRGADLQTTQLRALYPALLESDASRVALQLSEESSLCFRKVTFLDYVKAALCPDEYVESVEDYIDWHNGLFNKVLDHLQKFPDEAEKYVQIEKGLQKGSPVHWAVSQSLLLAFSHRPIEDRAPQPDLGFIYRPLREFFRHQNGNSPQTWKQLAVLEVRFHVSYLREEIIDWTHSFDTSTDFFDRVTTTPPQDLAHSLTECDVDAFRSLHPQSIINEDPYLQVMHRRWDRLCRAAQECIVVESGLAGLLADLAEASL